MTAVDFSAFVDELADASGEKILPFFRTALGVEDKGGAGRFDPVTAADRAAEVAIRALIKKNFPDHGIVGEELGNENPDAEYVWVVDPIDGTRSFICGLPTWTVLIALLDEGQPVLGVIDAPRLGERFIGHGDFGDLAVASGRRRLRTSQCRTLSEARLSTTDPFLFSAEDRVRFKQVRQASRMTRYGLDGYAYGRLAAGGLDLIIESGLAPHDLNALVPVVRAAGGAVGDWDGATDFSQGRLVAAASTELLQEAVAQLARRDGA